MKKIVKNLLKLTAATTITAFGCSSTAKFSQMTNKLASDSCAVKHKSLMGSTYKSLDGKSIKKSCIKDKLILNANDAVALQHHINMECGVVGAVATVGSIALTFKAIDSVEGISGRISESYQKLTSTISEKFADEYDDEAPEQDETQAQEQAPEETHVQEETQEQAPEETHVQEETPEQAPEAK